jgi:alkanesulfonate monooxygenase SsuD/methylene tetrahydromethanopterin reductase-like flavin-dependent oxidoreductase (luciferase family)
MTYAAACTERMRLGCVVFVSTLHSPVHLAKSIATLDQLSRGRIDVGVGTGGQARPFAAFGVDPDRYLARFTEGIELMKALWTEPRVTFDGEFWQLRDAPMEPCRSRSRSRRCGSARTGRSRCAGPCGWAMVSSARAPAARFAEQVQFVREALAAAAARPAPIAKRVYVAIGEDAAQGPAR